MYRFGTRKQKTQKRCPGFRAVGRNMLDACWMFLQFHQILLLPLPSWADRYAHFTIWAHQTAKLEARTEMSCREVKSSKLRWWNNAWTRHEWCGSCPGAIFMGQRSIDSATHIHILKEKIIILKINDIIYTQHFQRPWKKRTLYQRRFIAERRLFSKCWWRP